MSNISLSMCRGAKSTVISNRFIDELMPSANGSYVKVYIYLLRLISDSSELSLSLIAEHLDETENDIRRALKYWEKAGVLTVKYSAFGQITDIVLLNPDVGIEQEKPADIIKLHTGIQSLSENRPAASAQDVQTPSTALPQQEAPVAYGVADPVARTAYSQVVLPDSRPNYSSSQVNMLLDDKDFKVLAGNLTGKIGRPLNQMDLQYVIFYYECLGFGSDLICYLYDYCYSRNKTNNSYIEKVALNWAQEGVHTVEQAEQRSAVRFEQRNTVMKAFGLNRAPAPAEETYIGRWFNDMAFSSELVAEACNRTILQIQKADFKYADRILENWNTKNIHSLEELSRDDSERTALNSAKSSQTSSKSAQSSTKKNSANNAFNKFQQRSYSADDFASMEQMLLNKQG